MLCAFRLFLWIKGKIMNKILVEKYSALKESLNVMERVGIAFSGGTDSLLLLHMAHKCCREVRAFVVDTPFQTLEQTEFAKDIATKYGIIPNIIYEDFTDLIPAIRNDENRCYYCKKMMFTTIMSLADKYGLCYVLDGSNGSDESALRPGMRVLDELGIISPLKICDISKDEVREILKYEHVTYWSMPSSSCIASRIMTGTTITQELLQRTLQAESDLNEAGLEVIRVKNDGYRCNLQASKEDLVKINLDVAKYSNILLKYFEKVNISDIPRNR